jgi:3-oxoacyl-[acyl-carrier-protein] synthase II
MKHGSERVAITGVGLITALGNDAPTTFRRLVEGERGFAKVSLFDPTGQRSEIAAEVRDLQVGAVAPAAEAARWSRSDALALIAAREALSSAGIAPGSTSLSLAMGASTGGMFESEVDLVRMLSGQSETAALEHLVSFPVSASAERIASTVGSVERVATVCSACSSGANALIEALAWIGRGSAKRVLAGATDGLCRLTFAGFNSLGATDPSACRPFDAGRDGLTLGEGAAFLVLEPESEAVRRGARVLAWLSGWATAAEAHHITHPEASGATAARLLREAIRRANVPTSEVDYVNAHGTGTPHNDAMEARAIYETFGEQASRLPVSSVKGQIGHTLAAAGAMEAALTVLCIDAGTVLPTGGLESPEPIPRLGHVLRRGRTARIRVACSNSFGFGGADTVLVFEHADRSRREPQSAKERRGVVITGHATWGPSGGGAAGAPGGATDSARSPSARAIAALDAARSRRFDGATALVAAGAEQALRQVGLDPAGVGLVAGTAFGSVERSARFLRRVLDRGPRFASPAEFPHLLPSSPTGNSSVYLGLTGPVLSVTGPGADTELAVAVARDLLELGAAEAIVAGAVAAADELQARALWPLFGGSGATAEREGAVWLVLESALTAARRGAEVLAVVVDALQTSTGESGAWCGLRTPTHPERAVLLDAVQHRSVDALVAGSPWAGVARRRLEEGDRTHEPGGGMAIVAAVRLLTDSLADEVLVCTDSCERSVATHLAREEP